MQNLTPVGSCRKAALAEAFETEGSSHFPQTGGGTWIVIGRDNRRLKGAKNAPGRGVQIMILTNYTRRDNHADLKNKLAFNEPVSVRFDWPHVSRRALKTACRDKPTGCYQRVAKARRFTGSVFDGLTLRVGGSDHQCSSFYLSAPPLSSL